MQYEYDNFNCCSGCTLIHLPLFNHMNMINIVKTGNDEKMC